MTGKKTIRVSRDDFEQRARLCANRLEGRITWRDQSPDEARESCYDAILWAFREGEKVGRGDFE